MEFGVKLSTSTTSFGTVISAANEEHLYKTVIEKELPDDVMIELNEALVAVCTKLNSSTAK